VPPSPSKDTATGHLPAATHADAGAGKPLPAAACVDQPEVALGLKRPLDSTLILSAATNHVLQVDLAVVVEYLAAVLT